MKLVILDRDGVVNHDSDAYIKSPEEWRPIPGSIEAIARLSKAGLRVAIATNQSAIARGLIEPSTLAAIHSRMQRAVQDAGGRIDAVFFCPHGPDDGCDCRKPRPGMVLEILRRFRVDPADALLAGDSLRDLQAANAAGVRAALVLTGNGRRTYGEGGLPEGTRLFASLADFAAALAP